MFSSVVTALALAASISNVAATPITHVARGYAQDAEILEEYKGYHVRYLALKCQNQHNTQFFEDCCHPLLSWQKLSDRPAQCIPSASASSSAALAEPTAAPVDEDPIPDYDDDCEDETTTSYVAPAATSKAASTTAPVVSKAAAKSSSSEAPAYTQPESSQAPATTQAPTTHAAPTTSEKPATTSEKPETTEKPASATPTTSKAPATTTQASSGGDGANTGGFATFFYQNGVAGACGTVHGEYDKIVALDYRRYGDLGKQSSDCGRTVVITNTNNGKTVTATVADACPTCKNSNSLDLSLGAFTAIATQDDGMVPISWYFA